MKRNFTILSYIYTRYQFRVPFYKHDFVNLQKCSISMFKPFRDEQSKVVINDVARQKLTGKTLPALFTTQKRSMRKTRKGRSARLETSQDFSDSDSDSDDSDDEFSMGNKAYPEDDDLPASYKDVKVHIKSLRLDAVTSKGLNIARKKVEDYLLSSKIRRNGISVLKKNTTVSDGDYIDLISSVEDGTRKFKRVRVLHIKSEKTMSDRYNVYLRIWRANVSQPVENERNV